MHEYCACFPPVCLWFLSCFFILVNFNVALENASLGDRRSEVPTLREDRTAIILRGYSCSSNDRDTGPDSDEGFDGRSYDDDSIIVANAARLAAWRLFFSQFSFVFDTPMYPPLTLHLWVCSLSLSFVANFPLWTLRADDRSFTLPILKRCRPLWRWFDAKQYVLYGWCADTGPVHPNGSFHQTFHFSQSRTPQRERERGWEREIRGQRRRKKKEEEKEAAQSWRESSAQPYYYAYCATAHVLHTHTHKSPLRHLKSRKRSSFFLINVSSEVLPSVAPAPLHALVIE